MRALLLIVAIVVSSCRSSGALEAATATAAGAAALHWDEATMAAVCLAAADRAVDGAPTVDEANARAAAALAACDRAWRLYDVLAADLAALEDAIRADAEDGVLVSLMLKVGADVRAFEAAMQAVQ